jgi:carbamoyl-phosphate synthase large subunit
MLSVGYEIPKKNILISSGNALQKADLLGACQLLEARGYKLYATEGSAKYLAENGVSVERVIWPTEAQDPELAAQYKQAMEMLANKELDLVINIPKNFTHKELTNGYYVRRAAIDYNIPLITNARLATAFIRAFCAMSIDDIQIKSWDKY